MSEDDLRLAQFISGLAGPILVALLKMIWPDMPKTLRPIIAILTSSGTAMVATDSGVGTAAMIGLMGQGARDLADRAMILTGQRADKVRTDEMRALKRHP